jgi:CubicO group peptidase (beta-lactamase class C family)
MIPAFLIPLVVITAGGPEPAANVPKPGADKLASMIRTEYVSREAPGIQYVIVSRDSVLFSFADGLADIAADHPLTPQTTMMIYSMTKTFTAAAVLQLVDQGRLSLDEPVTKYVSDIPYGNQVTIRHLLAQMSGIPNPIPLRWVHLVEEHPWFDERAALREILRDHHELDFTPGARFGYSNISYWLLGQLIANVSGKAYETYMRENIFRRLGIPNAEIDFVIPSTANHARGYLPTWSFLNLIKGFILDDKYIGDYQDGWLQIRDHYLNGPAFGGMVASARAVATFLRDQLQDTSVLFSRQTKSLFFRQQVNQDGEAIEMTPGWHIGSCDIGAYYFKEGGGGGFHCEMRVYPSRRFASVVIANNTSFETRSFLNTLDKEFP